MKPYGIQRNWNAVEDLGKNGKAQKQSTHTKVKKIYHRIARRWKFSRKVKLNRAGISKAVMELE